MGGSEAFVKLVPGGRLCQPGAGELDAVTGSVSSKQEAFKNNTLVVVNIPVVDITLLPFITSCGNRGLDMNYIWKAGILVGFALLGSSSLASAQTIANTPNGQTIQPFGSPDTQTYGEVFTAPVTGTLTSFTLYLNGGVGSLYGGVGTWNGPPTFATGFGSPTNLYQSADVASVAGGPYTFSPDTAVIAGNQYVAYLSVFGDPDANNTTSMPLSSDNVSGIDYFVFNNSSDERGNPSWNYFANFGNAEFSATFNGSPPAGAPAPLAGAGLLSFFGAGSIALRKRVRRTFGLLMSRRFALA